MKFWRHDYKNFLLEQIGTCQYFSRILIAFTYRNGIWWHINTSIAQYSSERLPAILWIWNTRKLRRLLFIYPQLAFISTRILISTYTYKYFLFYLEYARVIIIIGSYVRPYSFSPVQRRPFIGRETLIVRVYSWTS